MAKFLCLFSFCLSALCAAGHPMPNSIVNLSILEHQIKGEAKMPLIELETATSHSYDSAANDDFFRNYLKQHIVATSEQSTWDTEIESIEIIVDHDPFVGDYKEVLVHFILTPKLTASLRDFTFNYDVVIHQVVTHKIMVFVQADWRNGIQEESQTEYLGTIHLDIPSGKILPLQIQLEEGSTWKGFLGMFLLGMNHIREGLDHILFLITLLLIAPLVIIDKGWSSYQGWRYALRRFLKISLAFTVGHSITLLIGSLNLIDFRVQYIEVLIAISILISAINCIKPIFFMKEILISGLFGLIHGLAFSLTLSHLELSTGGKLISILGFNLGIEAMQMIIMLCAFPILLLSKSKSYAFFRIAFAVLAIIVSVSWIAERISNHENFVTGYVNRLMM